MGSETILLDLTYLLRILSINTEDLFYSSTQIVYFFTCYFRDLGVILFYNGISVFIFILHIFPL